MSDHPIPTKQAILFGIALWTFIFVYSFIVMGVIGVDFSDPNLDFGPGHDLYRNFQLVMSPSFFVFTLVFLFYFFKRNEVNLSQSWIVGVIIMSTQFLFDLVFLVFIFGNGFDYFLSIVTLIYLLIPVLSYLICKYSTNLD